MIPCFSVNTLVGGRGGKEGECLSDRKKEPHVKVWDSSLRAEGGMRSKKKGGKDCAKSY